jgi:hypothetical protein
MPSALSVGAGAADPSVGGISSLCSARSDPPPQRDRDTSMNITTDVGGMRPTTVAFVNCFDATTFGRLVYLTAREKRRLRNVLAALHDFGHILCGSLEPALPALRFAEVIDHLRASVGEPLANAALASAERSFRSTEPEPAALMPVWAFEPDGGSEDVLLSSATLWNVNLLVEALRVEDEDDPVPVPAVRERFARWVAAAGSGPTLATSRLPGRDGSYVIFAAAALG